MTHPTAADWPASHAAAVMTVDKQLPLPDHPKTNNSTTTNGDCPRHYIAKADCSQPNSMMSCGTLFSPSAAAGPDSVMAADPAKPLVQQQLYQAFSESTQKLATAAASVSNGYCPDGCNEEAEDRLCPAPPPPAQTPAPKARGCIPMALVGRTLAWLLP